MEMTLENHKREFSSCDANITHMPGGFENIHACQSIPATYKTNVKYFTPTQKRDVFFVDMNE